MTRKFIFIAGVQKCGTTWLAQYFRNRPDTWMPRHELHVFDTEFLGTTQDVKRQTGNIEERIGALERRAQRQGFTVDPSVFEDLRVEAAEYRSLLQHPDQYGSLFARKMDSMPWVRLVGEKTPKYASLELTHWREIRARLVAAGFDPYVLVSFRDPVERAISQFRMVQASASRDPGRSIPLDPDGIESWMLSDSGVRRAQYRRTVEAISGAFPSDRVLFVIFEDLFDEVSLRRITDFVSLDYVPGEFEVVSNPGGFPWTCSDAVRMRLREAFDPTYVFAREFFGRERIDRLWKNA